MYKAVLAAFLCLAAAPAFADDDEYFPPVTNAAMKKECGSCHLAYPAGLLPRQAWQGIMDNLPKHFGEDASLPEPVRAEIAGYLAANSRDGRTVQPAALRISEQPWWVREHRKIGAATWDKPAIKSKSNCQACHRGAERGIFEED